MAVDPAHVFEAFTANGVSFVTGVPDSLLKHFCAYVTDNVPAERHVIAANEGSAVGLAAGHYLSSGNPALVYLQNSGLGNAVNPLLSMADPEVYAIPMVVMVGWRGAPGVNDEPQHVKQGAVTITMLEAMGVPVFVGDAESDWNDLVRKAVGEAKATSGPVALVVKPGAFASYALKDRGIQNNSEVLLTREAMIEAVLDTIPADSFIVSTTGMASRELFELRVARGEGHARDFLTVGSMGHASQIALGIALDQPDRRVVCLDGDGAVIMHAGCLSTVGQLQPKNLLHFVLNNGAHDSVGGQPTASTNVDFVALATANGYGHAVSVATQDQLSAAVPHALSLEGPALIELRIRPGARSDLGRPTTAPKENKAGFVNGLRR